MGYSTIDADEYRERLSVRRELEPQPGKSRALNRAIDAAKDEYILDGRDGAANQLAWEVLIVNNNCTDHTDSVIDE